MKKSDLERYVDMPHVIEIKRSADGGFFVSIPDLPGCFSQAETTQEAYEMILDAKKAWIEVALEDGETIPEPSDERTYSGRILLRIPPELHFELAKKAALQEVSLNQYLTYLLTKENEKQAIKFVQHLHKTAIVGKVDVSIISHPKREYRELPKSRIKKYE